MPDDKRETSLRSLVGTGLMTLALGGSLIAGGKIGGHLAMDRIGDHLAYSRASAVTIGQMGANLSDSVLSARSNFVLGAVGDTDIGAFTRNMHGIYAKEDPVSLEYYKAGAKWQDEHQLSDEDLVSLAQEILAENQQVEDLQTHLVRLAMSRFETREEAQAMVNMALLRGMLDSADGLVQIDDRILDRLDGFLDRAPQDAAVLLAGARNTAQDMFRTELAGNEKMFADLQNRLNTFPREEKVFSVMQGRSYVAGDNVSRIERVKVEEFRLDPVLAGIHDAPGGP